MLINLTSTCTVWYAYGNTCKHVSKVPLYLCGSVVSLSLPLEPSLTATNLCSLLGDVKDWSTFGLPYPLQIPFSKVLEIEQLYPDLSQRQSALIHFWLDRHPAPSWELVCYALYMKQEYEVLENIQNKYFKGTVCTYTIQCCVIVWLSKYAFCFVHSSLVCMFHNCHWFCH